MNITRNKAIEIATKEIDRLGYDAGIMMIKVTKYDTPWNEYLSEGPMDKYHAERKRMLKGRKYWAVYYYPNQEIKSKGGDVCIFVDSKTGEIITNVRWK